MRDAVHQATVSPARALWGVVRFLGRRPGWVALSILLLLTNITIELTLPQIIGDAITGLGRADGGFGGPSLAFIVGLFLGLVVVRTGVGFALGPIRNITAQRTLGDLRVAVYNALQRQTFTWHDNARTGELISRASTDVWRLQDFMFVCLLFAVDVGAGVTGTLFCLFALSPRLGWLTLGVLGPTLAAMAFFAVRLQPRWRRVHDLHSEMSTVIQENIAGVRVVKAFARETAEIEKFRGKREVYLRELLGAVNYWAARVPFAQFLFGLGVPLVLWVGGRQVIGGTLPLGDLAKAVLYLLGLGNRIGAVGQIASILQNAASSAQRVYEVLHAPVGLRPGRRPLPPDGRGAVRFEHVRFTYTREPSLRIESERPADPGSRSPAAPLPRGHSLDDVSFEVTPGQTVALVGPTGSGKSTLLALIPRFYEATEGRVFVDDADVKELDLESLRRAVGIVFQETFLFSASVADNIAFGRPEATREQIVRAATAARADEFIRELAEGYDTIVGERGVSLSGGQRQRIAIARALLLDPRIILLDDATSAVDPHTEREIRDATLELCRGRTTFVVAQRAATVRHADLILVMDAGRIVQRGRHAELLAAPGLYRELFRTQLGSEAAEDAAAGTGNANGPASTAAA